MTDDHDDPRARIGWPRAIATAVVVVALGFALLVYGANALLTHVHGTSRSSLVGIVTPVFFAVLVVLAFVLRRLQRRDVL